jgi:putative restriction endonuclease
MLGPALLTAFSQASQRFTLTGSTPEVVAPFRDWADEVKLEETYLRSELALPLTIAEERPRYVTSREAREQAFRSLILAEYGRLCCLCRSMFVLKDTSGMLVEAEAAHIIPVSEKGPDDPRNALSLCKRHHWAFDKGLFTFSDAREALISPAVRRAERQKFDLEEYEGEAMNPPSSESCRPDPMALAWHRDHTFRQ